MSDTPSISADEYRKHAQKGTLSQLVKDKEQDESSSGDPPENRDRRESRGEVSPSPETDSQHDLGLTEAHFVRKTLAKRFWVNPVGKPRQTQQDKWKSRPCVERYRNFADEIVYQSSEWSIPDSRFHVVFYVEAPTTKQERAGDPHHLKPDVDNLLKALFDALEDEDKYIWDCRASAFWTEEENGHIDIYSIHQTDKLT